MKTSSTSEFLRHAFAAPTRGVLGLVDDLLAVSREHGLQLDWTANHCRVRFQEDDLPVCIEVPFRKSVIRAALARIAVLCNQRNPNSVSPYGGHGELLVGAHATTAMRVAFVNTPDEQRLELTPLHKESTPMTSEAAALGQNAPGTNAGPEPIRTV
jgi:hypothetical protein